jgi:hypothetical protein
MEELLSGTPFDVAHVHEPFAPSAASIALRHSHALNVGTFHAPAERVLSTQVARRFVERFFGRLDARTASFAATRELMERTFPASYRVIAPGADHAAPRERPPGDPVRIAFCGGEERGALRLFLRRAAAAARGLDWQGDGVRAQRRRARRIRSALRERVRVVGDGSPPPRRWPARTSSCRLARGIAAPGQRGPRARRGARCPLAARLPPTRRCSTTGSSGCSSSRATSRPSPRSSSG